MIIFLHFHKCGGTSIVQSFSKRYKLYSTHKNGNPWNRKENTLVPFWTYGSNRLFRWCQRLEGRKVEFVALEWGFFSGFLGLNYIRCARYFACLRDPLKRLVSNYIFNGGDQKFGSIEEYQEKDFTWKSGPLSIATNYNKPNYYVKVLNSLEDPNVFVTLGHFENARQILCSFEVIIILDHPETFKLLKSNFGVEMLHQKKNKTSKHYSISAEFEQKFRYENHWDYQLYQFCRDRVLSKI